MQTVRVYGALRALGELNGCEDVRGLRLEVRRGWAVLRRFRVLETGKVNSGSKCMGRARHKDNARGVARRRGGKQFRREQLREKERPDVVSGKLAF